MRAAEELIFGPDNVTSGARSDLAQARFARHLCGAAVRHLYGMHTGAYCVCTGAYGMPTGAYCVCTGAYGMCTGALRKLYGICTGAVRELQRAAPRCVRARRGAAAGGG